MHDAQKPETTATTDFQRPNVIFQLKTREGVQDSINLIVDAMRPSLGPAAAHGGPHPQRLCQAFPTNNPPPFIATTPPVPCIPKHQLFSARNYRAHLYSKPRSVIYTAHCRQPRRLRSQHSGTRRVCCLPLLPCAALLGTAPKFRMYDLEAFSPTAQRPRPVACT